MFRHSEDVSRRERPYYIRLTATTDDTSPGSRDTHLPGHVLAKVMATSVSALPAEDLLHSCGAARWREDELARLSVVHRELTVGGGEGVS